MQLLTVKCFVSGERRWYMYIVLSSELGRQSYHKDMDGFVCPPLSREYIILSVGRSPKMGIIPSKYMHWSLAEVNILISISLLWEFKRWWLKDLQPSFFVLAIMVLFKVALRFWTFMLILYLYSSFHSKNFFKNI